MNNEQIKDNIINQLKDLTIADQIEILGNTLLAIGTSYLSVDTDKDLISQLVAYRKEHGESLPVALAMQGLTMLIWLDKWKQSPQN